MAKIERSIERTHDHFTLIVCSLLITSAKEDMYLPVSIWLSERILMNFLEGEMSDRNRLIK